jgi:hypothetical protein
LGERFVLPLSIAAVGIAALGVTAPGQAVSRTVRTALHSSDAGSVAGVSASRRPRAGFLLALDRDGRYPRSVIPPTVGEAGPRGAQGGRGAEGPPGAPGGYTFTTRSPQGRQISRFGDQRTTMGRLEDLPGGSWLLLGQLTPGGVAGAEEVACSLVYRNIVLTSSRATVGRGAGGQRVASLTVLGPWSTAEPSSVALDCGLESDPGGEAGGESVTLSAIRVGSLEVRRQGP